MARHEDLTTVAGGLQFVMAVTNVNDTTPTLAEMTTAFPSLQAGQLGIVKDNDAATISFVVWTTNGTNRFWLKGTLGL